MTEPDDPMPLFLEIVDGDEAMDAVFGPEGPTPFTPLGSGCMFWRALILGRHEYLTALQTLSNHPPAFGDYSEVEALLQGYSLMQVVEHPTGYETQIGYVRFMPDTGHSMRAFDDGQLDDYVVLTVVSRDGASGPWRVWGYSKSYFPSVDEIFGS